MACLLQQARPERLDHYSCPGTSTCPSTGASARPGTGSTFTIELPVVELTESPNGGPDGASGAPTASVR